MELSKATIGDMAHELGRRGLKGFIVCELNGHWEAAGIVGSELPPPDEMRRRAADAVAALKQWDAPPT